MRRLLIAALAAIALLPPLAHSKALVVYERYDANATGSDPAYKDYLHMQERMTYAFLDLMNRTNANYTLVPFPYMKTEWARNGQLVSGWNPTTATGARFEQFDCVIFLSARGGKSATLRPMAQGRGPMRSDSLYRFDRLPLVPTAYLFGADMGSAGLSSYAPFSTVAACSTGAKASAVTPAAQPQLVYCSDTGKTWFSAANQSGYGSAGSGENAGIVLTRAVAGGVRGLLGSRQSFYNTVPWATATNNLDCNACDSTYGNQSEPDTVIAWERLLIGRSADGQSANTRIVFANLMGASPCSEGNTNIPCEFDEPTAMYILAHMDSLTGGKIWDKPAGVKTLQAAVTIDAAFSRGGRRFAGGIVPTDSTVLIASLDSLRTLGIPLTVGVNVDSMSTYASEKNWWPRAGQVRYSPQAWAGLKLSEDGTQDSTRAIASSTTAPADVFGRYRLRTALGVTTDTLSVYAGLVNSRSIVASYFPGLVSGLCMAPLDDYSPKNMNWSTGPGADSILYVIARAGFTCLRTDVQARDASMFRIPIGTNKDLVRGWWPRQARIYSPLLGGYFNVLGHSGHSISGSKYSWIPIDSISGSAGFGGNGPGPATIPNQMVGRFWHGFVHEEFTDPDWWMHDSDAVNAGSNSFLGVIWAAEDFKSPMRHSSIIKMHASDFGGIPNGPPKRPGWWALKSIKNQFDAINKAAGRTVCAFVWPEYIQP